MSLPREGEREVEGVVLEALPNGLYRVEAPGGRKVLAHVGGRARLNPARFIPQVRVSLVLSPFDPARGRITGMVR